jgi:Domain of unknown function (DUF1508)
MIYLRQGYATRLTAQKKTDGGVVIRHPGYGALLLSDSELDQSELMQLRREREIIASGQGCKSKTAAEKGIESIKINAPRATLIDNTAWHGGTPSAK